jgi:hypothetical protein
MIEIRWPGGAVEQFKDVKADQIRRLHARGDGDEVAAAKVQQ